MQENEVRTELVIPAPVDDVWRVLVDFAGYADWNPVMEYTQVDGVKTKVRSAKGTPYEIEFDGEITSMEPYVLTSQGGDPELFFGRHRWELTPVEGGTHLVNAETWTGSMATDVLAQHREVITEQFHAFNQALLRLFCDKSLQRVRKGETPPPHKNDLQVADAVSHSEQVSL